MDAGHEDRRCKGKILTVFLYAVIHFDSSRPIDNYIKYSS